MRCCTCSAAARIARVSSEGPFSGAGWGSDPASAPGGRTALILPFAWPLLEPLALVGASLMRGIVDRRPLLGGVGATQAQMARPAERVHIGEERLQQRVDLGGPLDLRDVAAAVEDDLLRAGQPLLDVALETARDELVLRPPHEERRGLELGEAGIEAALAEGPVQVD